jgi:hypothetical protein
MLAANTRDRAHPSLQECRNAYQGHRRRPDPRSSRGARGCAEDGQSRRRGRWQLLFRRSGTGDSNHLQLEPGCTHLQTSCRRLAMGAHHGACPATLLSKACRNRADWAADHCLGGVRRKPGAGRRRVACSGSDSILSNHGNSLDYPVETAREMDADRTLEFAPARVKLKQLYYLAISPIE